MNEHPVHHHQLGPHAHVMNPEMEAVHTETTEVLLSLLSQNKALSGKGVEKREIIYTHILVLQKAFQNAWDVASSFLTGSSSRF